MKKVVTIIIICVLFITTGVLAYTTYNLYQENQELQEDIDDLKDEKKSSSNNNYNNSSKDDTTNKVVDKVVDKVDENNNNNNNNTIFGEKNETSDKYSNIEEITYSKLESKLKKGNSFILVVTQTGCSHCDAYKPTLNKVLKENKITAYEIDIRKLSEEEYEKFNHFVYVAGTPTTIFIKNGAEESTSQRLNGNVSSERIVSHLKALEYIK